MLLGVILLLAATMDLTTWYKRNPILADESTDIKSDSNLSTSPPVRGKHGTDDIHPSRIISNWM